MWRGSEFCIGWRLNKYDEMVLEKREKIDRDEIKEQDKRTKRRGRRGWEDGGN